jgi:hypothetical protein
MRALTVMIIRHAKKPDRSFPGSGFNENGDGNPRMATRRSLGDTLWLGARITRLPHSGFYLRGHSG